MREGLLAALLEVHVTIADVALGVVREELGSDVLLPSIIPVVVKFVRLPLTS